MEQALRRAFETGYNPFKTVAMSEIDWFLQNDSLYGKFKDPKVKGICSANISRILLDPAFWQALGKAMGWGKFIWKTASINCNACKAVTGGSCGTHGDSIQGSGQRWLYEWHLCIDHLAEGKSADEFFLSLLSK